MYREQYDAPPALDAATVTKLLRNLCMIVVIPLVGALYRGSSKEHSMRRGLRWSQAVPLFVLGFLLAATVRTTGDLGERAFGLLDRATWKQGLAQADTLAAMCLTVAMAAVGLGTGLGRIRRLGGKPFCVGLAAALVVGVVSATLIALLGASL